MNRTILLRDRCVTYTLTRKPVKRINIRIRIDGSIGISAPRYVPVEEIETLLQNRADRILQTLDHFAMLEKQAPRFPSYKQGDVLWLLGRPYTISLCKGENNTVQLEHERLILTVRDPDSKEQRQSTVHVFLTKHCRQVTTALCCQIQDQLAERGVPMPAVHVRSMTSRWGSCHPTRKKVTFARQLIEAPMPCVEYVVWHEMIHFLHPDHSPAFYGDLARYLPDWSSRRTILNSYSYRQ